MSRLLKKTINIREGVEVLLSDNILDVRGPKGALSVKIPEFIDINISDSEIKVGIKKNGGRKNHSAMAGTIWSLIRNSIIGVSDGFTKVLEIKGVGYRAGIEGKELVLWLGYSHPVKFKVPEGIDISVQKNFISVSGIDKEKVGLVAAKIRNFRKPEPYKGKGIRYKDEVIKIKVGKKAVGASG